MDTPLKPDLTGLSAEVIAYIDWLEGQLSQVSLAGDRGRRSADEEAPEPPTTINIVSISHNGLIKRTPRHLYSRQRRGGMGVFDIELPDDDSPAALVTADESDTILIFTSGGRAYRLPLGALPESPVRARGQALASVIALPLHEHVVAALPSVLAATAAGRPGEYVAMLSQRGWIRRVRASFLGPSMIQGTIFHDVKEGGPLVAAGWTDGKGDLFIATTDGKAIRFAESQVPTRGCLGIRLDVVDVAAAVCGVAPDGGVFMMGQDGAGTVRLMSGFSANKAPGAGGKVAMKTGHLVSAVPVNSASDLWIISRLGKIIRFDAMDVPAKEGVVQGVSCMTLRADEVSAVMSADSGRDIVA